MSRAKGGRCRHRGLRVHRIAVAAGHSKPYWEAGGYWFKCVTCHDVIPRGPANDEPEEVRIEMRAAELAVMPAGSYCSADAWCGWNAHAHDYDLTPNEAEGHAEEEAAWLSRQIATHDPARDEEG